jgi:DNA-binding NtrC family response regulator
MGESGVGKEVSQIIHALSARKHNPLLLLTVAQYRKERPIRGYSVMKKVLRCS